MHRKIFGHMAQLIFDQLWNWMTVSLIRKILFSEGTKNVKGKHNAYQGAGTDRDNKVHHAYYQWVALFLFMQGIMFNVPHFLWTVWENEKMDRLTVTLRG